MPLRTTDATVSDFEEAFDKFKAESSASGARAKLLLLLLFLADKDPATSRSWCPAPPPAQQQSIVPITNIRENKAALSSASLKIIYQFIVSAASKGKSFNLQPADCNVAEPVIYEKLESSESDVALLRVYVGDRPTWRNPSNPWRVDPRFKLTGVPTLIRWENEAIAGRLEDHEAHIADKIDALLAIN